MKTALHALCGAAAVVLAAQALAQEVKTVNSKSWELSGNIQLQHLYNADIKGDASRTNEGFRIRRGRLVAKGKLTDYVETSFQIDVRDNSPRLKDAEGKIKLGSALYFRFGQFKVPVWREELRSSTRLLLVERSAAADFLVNNNISARHIGVEFGRAPKEGLQFTFNLSNGAGEGGREDAGQSKSGTINNGKLLTGRFNWIASKTFQLGASGLVNHVGVKTLTADNTGTITALTPDFGAYFTTGEKSQLDIEGGLALGKISKEFIGAAATEDRKFTLFDVTGRWLTPFSAANASLGGLDAFELAAGFTLVDPNTAATNGETKYLRFGPAFYFGKQTRLQFNAEIEMPGADGAENVFQVRSQANFVF
jgi:hypothetical protein